MNRTERLYALVDELRAAAPRPRTVEWLAGRYGVSRRTVQRDLQALMEAGVPVRVEAGRHGGWVIDRDTALPPINLPAAEALAVAAALAGAEQTTPFSAAGPTAMRKLAAALSESAAEEVRALTERIHVLPARTTPGVLPIVERAVALQRVVWIRYADAAGQESEREVEPGGLLTASGSWYLIGWCRSRRAGRGFRLDRVLAAELRDEPCPARTVPLLDRALAERVRRAETLRSLSLDRRPADTAGPPRAAARPGRSRGGS
ncbi:WYL domain-containing protein [Nonomuraea sp. 3-1Str]|uniref:helix-turn-helix transcriptional regulator n=1 Tax=Nonomuraea sp. 3-1Str TaxID=2929801 RepID=UPI00285DD45F|nr:WYL domain-containing protein [Nonomuraea sp. 3-1Str]MDR8413248.1 WYL domain-containing protein [Nonomuraea sp. 3-1Str]